ncbi:haloacid dehalogenase [Cystobacter fuscus]|uniref:Haloacid dehalogenase n=1 Tax=Cystobacter fuscus TaxID=43 RepID=A0A250IZ89_9BACT|nr:haloacid dehalogenase [Cystobacter fuscus]ATB36590.1 haloacid dehalogenase [Cystobacter fuscus]
MTRTVTQPLALMLWILSAIPSSASAQLTCPDYASVANPPALQGPARKSFRHSGNQILSWTNPPYHMVHDQLVPVGTPATVVGKFDYGGVFHKDLEDEDVHVYLMGTLTPGWEYVGKYRTDTDGKVYVPLTRPVGEYRVKMIVEGDLSSATGFVSVVEPGRKSVLFDIDGTLTLNDFEAVGDYLGVSTAQAYAHAVEVVNSYAALGYQIIYLTARPYWVAKDTREWIDYQGLLEGHVHTNPYGDGPIPPDTQQYKTDYLTYLLEDVGLDIVRVYGNATTDIGAYAAVGLPKSETFIIGEHAGSEGTMPIRNDYLQHLNTVVASTPGAGCTPR